MCKRALLSHPMWKRAQLSVIPKFFLVDVEEGAAVQSLIFFSVDLEEGAAVRSLIFFSANLEEGASV